MNAPQSTDERCCSCRDDEAYKYGECFCLCHTRNNQDEVEARYQQIMHDWGVGRLAPRSMKR
jgi:hypothetical protein